MFKKIIYLFSIVISYLFFGTVLFYGDHNYMMPSTFAFSFCLAYFIKKTNWIKDKSILFYLFPALLVFLLLLLTSLYNVWDGVPSFMVTFSYLLFIPIFFYLGYLFYKHKKFVFLILIFPLLYINYAYVFPNSFSYFNFNNKLVYEEMADISFLNAKKENMKLLKDKIIVLDFWSTFCGICYEKFPEFESIYNTYKNNNNVLLYAVHVSYRDDKFEDVIHLLDEYEYSFPLLYALDKDEIKNKFDVKQFPTVIIIKNNIIRYRGSLISDKNVIIGNTIKNIERLINEE